ncbi:Stress-response A/B barrel domain-containing protein [Heracleum sosnowskyi]|uniref:Stress-response A/B barrel domain-containing protein n=1 Tax=Heracleum sosnowskyi TaxID=360622 RepID=A0AAD8HWX5_9APIA|nr:Stress-response A/B barrel domain-containing protein [Heracleum sosnowskyi]
MMNIQAYSFSPYTYILNNSCSRALASAAKPFNVFGRNIWSGQIKIQTSVFSAPEGMNLSTQKPKRKVVEHITLVKANEGLSDEEEKDMLDYLYTCQYQMGGIVSISLGRISNKNPDKYTHAIFMRFQRKEDLAKFYDNPFYLGVIKEHVSPYCHDMLHADFESEVDDDILPIFRKGEEFNYGVEFVLLVALDGSAEDALASLSKLMIEFPSLIVQYTQGLNFNVGSKEFTHVVFVRFRSSEAFKIFSESSEYKDIWRSKFHPVIHKVISVNYSVDPVGTEVM